MVISGRLFARNPTTSSKKINIATPAYQGRYCSAYVRSLYMLLTASTESGLSFSFSEIDYSDIVVSRNYLISNFYFNKPDCDYILFLDSDMGFPPRLAQEMLSLSEDVVGVIYHKRDLDLKKLHSLKDIQFKKAYAKACDFIGEPGKPHPRNPSFRLVSSCGTGILLISRSCIHTMIKECPDIIDTKRFKKTSFGHKFESFITPFNKIELNDRELSEDLSFCYRWKELCKQSIYANIVHEIEHVSSITLKTCFADLL